MKKNFSLSALMTLFVGAAFAATPLPPSEVPSNLTVVPTPGSTIDVSPNKSPRGCSAIDFTYAGEDIAINPACTTPAKIYKDDFTTPVEESMRRSVDLMTHVTATVLFSGLYNQNGTYKIEVPDGFFARYVGEDDNGNVAVGAPLPGATLYYRINVAWYAEPVNDLVVPELDRIILHFPDADEVSFGTYYDAEFGSFEGEMVGLTRDIVDLDGDGKATDVVLGFDQDGVSYVLSTPGQWLLTISAGGFNYVQDGESLSTDEIRLTYFVPEAPEPSIWPYCDETIEDGFTYFELTVPSGFDFESDYGFSANDRAVNNLYTANDYGQVDTTAPVAIAKILRGECDIMQGRLYLALFDPSTLEPLNFELDDHGFQSYLYSVVPGTLKPWKPEVSGNYCLVLDKSLYSGMYTSIMAGSTAKYVNSEPYRFYYDVVGSGSTAVKNIEEAVAGSDNVNAYTLTGIRILKNAPKADVNNLPAGLYIVNGKKVVVK